MIADKEEAIVVESMKDGLHIYDNPVGVMTNNPPFNIMNFALNDYASLSPKQPENTFGTSLHLYSRGMGGLGLPGDLSSKSRFIKVAYTKLNSKSKEDENSAVHQFFKILGSVEQQYGLCEVTPGAYEYTIYSSCVNIEEGIYYYTTYNNSHIHGVNMHHTDLDASTLTIHKLIKDEPLDII
jgi:choloylglycine hydrolase